MRGEVINEMFFYSNPFLPPLPHKNVIPPLKTAQNLILGEGGVAGVGGSGVCFDVSARGFRLQG